MLIDGFSTMESTFLGLLTGVIFLFVSLIGSTIFLYDYKKNCLLDRKTVFKGFYQFGLISLLSILFIVILDYVYFEFFDKTIPVSFVNAINDVLSKSGQSDEVINELKNLPLMVQNGVIVFIGGLIGIPFAILLSSSFVKNVRLNEFR